MKKKQANTAARKASFLKRNLLLLSPFVKPVMAIDAVANGLGCKFLVNLFIIISAGQEIQTAETMSLFRHDSELNGVLPKQQLPAVKPGKNR